MPTYEYECTHCGYNFEAFQKMSDKPLQKCPKCNHKVKRLIGSGSGIIFKGTGFYATDYRKKTSPTVSDSQNKACPKDKQDCKTCQSPK